MADERLARLAEADRAHREAGRALHAAVASARDEGCTWADVGAVLGVSRQAAFKRFGSPRDPRSGATMTPRDHGDLAVLVERAFRAVDDGDYPAVAAAMAPGIADVLTREAVLDTWAGAVAETGNLTGCRDTVVEAPADDQGRRTPLPEGGAGAALGMVVGHTTLVCEAGEWAGRVAVDGDGLIVGMLILPVDPASWGPLPF